MAIECKMYYPNEEKRQFHENWHLPVRDICAVNHMGLVLGLVFAHRFMKIDWPNKESRVIFSNAFLGYQPRRNGDFILMKSKFAGRGLTKLTNLLSMAYSSHF